LPFYGALCIAFVIARKEMAAENKLSDKQLKSLLGKRAEDLPGFLLNDISIKVVYV